MPYRIRRMRWRIAGAYILLIALTLTLLTLVVLQLLRTTYLQTLAAGLAGQARLVAALAAAQPAGTAADQRVALVRDWGDQLSARVTLIAADGTVLADSLLPPAARENLGGRPEVHDALTRGSGESDRISTATGDERFYVAAPFGPRGAPTGVARVGVPLTTIARAQARLAITVLLAALLAATGALALAVWIARRTTQPLLELRAMAERLAAGDLDVRVPIPRDEEVAALAQDFNVMASRLRQLIATVEAERRRLATILATMADGILMLDPNDQITLVNHAAEQLVPVPAAALPAPLRDLPIGAPLAAARQALVDRGSLARVIVDAVVSPATGRALRAIVTPLPAPEQDRALVVLQDLTDLRRAEQARRSLLANISHDLRTPLASLQAMIETLQDGALDDRAAAQDFVARMDDEVQSLNRLVAEFLELARIESGQLELHPAPLDMRALLEGVAARMDAQAAQHSVTLMLELPQALPAVIADWARVEQVVLNLLQNALTFTPRGGRITVGASIQDEQVKEDSNGWYRFLALS
ncbi:MAG TPA: histidine kinase dimerization/phospho-acceptor domain-containing protein [Roseiflexaceae bacterium]